MDLLPPNTHKNRRLAKSAKPHNYHVIKSIYTAIGTLFARTMD